MVCVPCFIIPVLLFVWHKFIQPFILRYWNPWEKKDEQGNVIKSGPEFPFQCKGESCPFPLAKKDPALSIKNAESELSSSSGNEENDMKKES